MAKLIVYIDFIPIYKNLGCILLKNQKNGFKERLVKDVKIFLKKRKTKSINEKHRARTI